MRAVLPVAAGLLLAAAAAAFPQEAPAPPVPAPRGQEFVGSGTCRDCHAAFYEKWSTSFHGLAMQPFSERVAARLRPHAEDVAVGDLRYRAVIEGGGGRVVERGPAGERSYAIEQALGGKNVFYFLTPLDRGRLQVLPVAYDVRRGEWYDTAASGMRHFPDRAEATVDWRDREYTFNTSCFGCHVSQVSVNYEEATDSYRTTWREPGINCETCHGPAGAHDDLFRKAAAGGPKPDALHVVRTKGFTPEQVNDLCNTCHAKAIPVTGSFPPGGRFLDHFDLATLENPDYHPDGRDLGENYTATSWRMSPCVKAGGLSCMHCHTSSGRNRHAGEAADNACLPCHAERVANAAEHTMHAGGTPGSRCVDCHMPTTEFARMRRTDHSMRPPAPAATARFGSPNACNLCHADRDAAWADGLVRKWRKRDYQAPVLERAALVDEARKGEWRRLPAIAALVTAPDRDEVTAASVARLLRSCEDPARIPVLVAAMKDGSPLVRAAAAESLDRVFTRETVAALLAATRDGFRLVRVRAAASLAGLPPGDMEPAARAGLDAATAELVSSFRARPDDASSRHNEGNFRLDRGEFDRAVECFERAFLLRPDVAAPLVNLAMAHHAAGNPDRAEEALRRALKAEPRNVPALLNLGMLLGERNRAKEAEAAFRSAFECDPRSAAAAFNVGVLCGEARLEEAVTWTRKAAALAPADPKFAYTAAYYLARKGDADGAIALLRPVADRGDPHPDAYALLATLHLGAGRREEAAAAYRAAADNPRLPERVRAWFAARAEESGK